MEQIQPQMNISDNVESYTWHKLSRAHNLGPRLLDCATQFYGELGIFESWDEFWCFPNDPPDFSIDHPAFSLYAHFFIYLWRPDLETELSLGGQENLTFANLILQDAKSEFGSFERKIMTAALKSPYTFFEIRAVNPGKSVVVLDLFQNREVEVWEKLGSGVFTVGGLLFGRTLTVNEVSVFYPLMPFVYPDVLKPEVLKLKKELFGKKAKVAVKELLDCDFELRELCHTISAHFYPMT